MLELGLAGCWLSIELKKYTSMEGLKCCFMYNRLLLYNLEKIVLCITSCFLYQRPQQVCCVSIFFYFKIQIVLSDTIWAWSWFMFTWFWLGSKQIYGHFLSCLCMHNTGMWCLFWFILCTWTNTNSLKYIKLDHGCRNQEVELIGWFIDSGFIGDFFDKSEIFSQIGVYSVNR